MSTGENKSLSECLQTCLFETFSSEYGDACQHRHDYHINTHSASQYKMKPSYKISHLVETDNPLWRPSYIQLNFMWMMRIKSTKTSQNYAFLKFLYQQSPREMFHITDPSLWEKVNIK